MRSLDDVVARRLPGSATKRTGKGAGRLWLHGPAMVEVRFAQLRGGAKATPLVPGTLGLPEGEEADLFADADSPNLERWRAAKADLAEIQVQEKRAAVCSTEAADGLWQQVAACIRRSGDAIQRQYGPEALALLDEGITEAERAVGEWMANAAA